MGEITSANIQEKLKQAEIRTIQWASGQLVVWPDCYDWKSKEGESLLSSLSEAELEALKSEHRALKITCLNCGKEFWVAPSLRETKYCSRECYFMKIRKKKSEILLSTSAVG